MGKPTTTDFLAAADGAYSGDPAGTSGLSVLTGIGGASVEATDPARGFHGVALETASGQVIVSFEGTALGSLQTRPTFVEAQLAGDRAIALGQESAAYADALRFTRRAVAAAEAQGISKADVFLDGHSAGGADAEFVAARTGLGGDTFGAPGIPSADVDGARPSHLTDFVDFGDPVGNYSQNPDQVGHLLLGDGIVRYGAATYVGQPSDAGRLAAAGQLFGTSAVGTATAAGLVVQGILDHHLIEDYASDLGVTLPGGQAGAGSGVSAADVGHAIESITGINGDLGTGGIGGALGGLGLDDAAGASTIERLLGSAARAHAR